MTNKNCLSYWFPKLESVIPDRVPHTYIVPAPPEGLFALLDGKAPQEWGSFLANLRYGAEQVGGYPCFLRTGHTSGKHRWKDTCCIAKPTDFGQHVYNLVEFSECCGLFGLPYDVWAVREWLSGPIVGIAPRYHDMPVRREFRAFIRDGAITCINPYWPLESLREGGCGKATLREAESNMNVLGDDEAELRTLIGKVASAFPEFWSVDALLTDRGWLITDMSLGQSSWHTPGCSCGQGKE